MAALTTVGTGGAPTVALLLATHNGARFIDAQLESLRHNSTPFTVHWLDDHSSDDTPNVVCSCAARYGIPLVRWQGDKRLGAHGAFYHLLDRVEADIYLFCDQDDIWQAHKIDFTVTDLIPDLLRPALSFSDPLMFRGDQPDFLVPASVVTRVRPPRALEEARSFMSPCAWGHTQGLTRPLRDTYLRHKEIARTYSMGHDWWMYLLARACGEARMLTNVPTTLYRRHGNNFSEFFFSARTLPQLWTLQHALRQGIARQAQGFILASETLPAGAQRDRLVALARTISTLDRRQSPGAVARLVRSRAMWPDARIAAWLAAGCLCGDASA